MSTEPHTTTDGPSNASEASERTQLESEEMDLRGRVVMLEDELATLTHATQGLAFGTLCVGVGLLLLIVLRTRGGVA